MTYKGAILDCTVMHYPPLLYEVKEYLGIGFEIETVVKTFDNAIDIAKKNNTTSFIASPLEFLTNESYLK